MDVRAPQDAPLNKCLGNSECPELEEWCVKLLADKCTSFKASRDDDGTIIGVFLNAHISSTVSARPQLQHCIDTNHLTTPKTPNTPHI